MKSGNKRFFRQTGFTMVEIMVGLAIGMLATVVIMQVFSVFEGQKRTTTGTADAQTSGSIALYNIVRETQFAGYPLMPIPVPGGDSQSPLIKCPAPTFGATGITSISPVTIDNDVAASGVSPSDRITIRYGNSLSGGISTTIGALVGNDATVDSNLGCQAGDIALITNNTTCAMTGVSAVPGTTTITLADNTAATAGAAVAGASIACLGAWNEIVYAVNNGSLQRRGQDAVAGIANLQAQYGISAGGLLNTDPNFNRVTQWVDAVDGQASGNWGAGLTVADRNRIKAVRIAIVARNAKMEPGDVTAACNSTTLSNPTGLCAWAGSASSPAPTVNLSAGDADWQRYRYRVFETIIPLRNVIWSKDTL